MVARKSVVTIFVRHSAECAHHNKPFYRGCDCAKWLRYSGSACFCKAKARVKPHSQHRLAADTRSWPVAEDKRAELQAQLDSGDTGSPLPMVREATRATIAQQVQTFITAKQSEGRGHATIRKLRQQLGLFEQFLANRGTFFAADITDTDVIDFRASWKSWKSGRTRQKAQTNVRSFLRFCCKGTHRTELLDVLKTIKLSRADEERLEPQPFSEEELTKLLAQVPKTFADDAAKAAKITTLIHFMVATGTAIRDTIQLERSHITDGWLRFKRQKTGKEVNQKLDEGLHRELLAVANSNPKYVFWNGMSRPTSATGLWQEDLRTVMKAAGLWIKGNLSHRFRDTAVDFWLGEGCSLVEIAAMIGDTVTVLEKHYKKQLSKRLEERLAKVPTRTWGASA